MYVGNHMFLEAPRTGEKVQMADLRTPYWAQQFAGGRRVVALAPSTSGSSSPVAAPVQSDVTSSASGTTPAFSTLPTAGTTPTADAATTAGTVPTAGTSAATPGPPATPGTAEFQAYQHLGHRHTVQFLQAIQPSSASPSATPATASGSVTPMDVSSTGQPDVEQIVGAPSAAAQSPSFGGLADVAGQTSAPAGSVISVSSTMLTSGQQTFAAHVAALTGLDPRVVAAWELAEESGGAAQARQAASNFNWLNIGYFDSGTGAIAFDQAFGDPVTAAEQTARFLKGSWGGASEGIRNILQTVGKSPDQQMMAIANSGWASSHYDNGANLRGTFDELSDIKIVTAPAAAPAAAAVAGAASPMASD
jgi:hypothetical protein